jgi:glycosyltransferase involved in cell wall biosynthesis
MSLLRAPAPDSLEITLLVVDNNSTDDTRQVVEQIQRQSQRALIYVREAKQGVSAARNGGLAAGRSEIIGFVDDDEEVDPHWFFVIAREFSDAATLYIGGPYLPNRDVSLPAWIPPGCGGVIGLHEVRPRSHFGAGFPGNLNGGNAVFRRTVFEIVGPYNTRLGRTARGLLSEEDAELYRRIVSAGLCGIYVPDLIIYHHVPSSRLTRKYYRSWFYWRGISHGVADRSQRESAAYLFGLPRYRIRQALAGLTAVPFSFSSKHISGLAFRRELAVWDLIGFIRGKYLFNTESFYELDPHRDVG